MVDACLANGDLDGAVEVCREMKQALPDLVAQYRVVVLIGLLIAQGRRVCNIHECVWPCTLFEPCLGSLA